MPRPLVPRRDVRAVFDLAYLDTLSGMPSLLLFVSERTQYLLNNLVASDISDPHRYSLGWYYDSYKPLSTAGDGWDLFGDVVQGAKVELVPTVYNGDLKTDIERLVKRCGPVTALTFGTTQTLPAGNQVVDVFTASGERMYLFTLNSVRVTQGGCTNYYLAVYRANGVLHTFDGPIVPVLSQFYHSNKQIWIAPGDIVRSYFYGCQANTIIEHRVAVVEHAIYTAIL